MTPWAAGVIEARGVLTCARRGPTGLRCRLVVVSHDPIVVEALQLVLAVGATRRLPAGTGNRKHRAYEWRVEQRADVEAALRAILPDLTGGGMRRRAVVAALAMLHAHRTGIATRSSVETKAGAHNARRHGAARGYGT